MKQLFFILSLLSASLFAQNNKVKVLTFESYMNIVKKHHPLAKQADIQGLKGAANLRKSRGAFDPKAFSDVSQKYFKDQQYYSIINSGLKIPTWYGIEVKGGYEQNNGVFLNPENATPGAGLWYAGVSVPIGQGLFIDQRRAALRQAKIYQESTVVERKILYNELLYKAGKAYWDWFMNYNTVKVYEEAVQVANQRFEAVKQGASVGDRPAIDTVEASIQVQNRLLSLQEAQLNYTNSSALLSTYLWADGIAPLEVGDATPSIANATNAVNVNAEFKNQLDSLSINHPVLQQYRYKIKQLNIDKK